MNPFNVVADVKHNAGKNVEYQREANSKKRRVNKKQPDFSYRNIKFFAKVGTYPERVPLEKSNDLL